MAKRTRKRVRNLERLHEDCNHPTGHDLAEGYTAEMAVADDVKSAAEMAQDATAQRAARGNPANVADFNAERGGSSPRRVAVGARDLDQQPGLQRLVTSLRSTNTYNYVGQAGFNSAFGHTDRPADAPGDTVTVAGFDAANPAGTYAGMMPVDVSPRRDEGYHQHRESATPPNGGHSLSNPESHAVSNKSRVQQMKEALFGE